MASTAKLNVTAEATVQEENLHDIAAIHLNVEEVTAGHPRITRIT